MGKTDPTNPDNYKCQFMIPVPMETPRVRVLRALPVFGFYGVPDRAAEVLFENVRVPVPNFLIGAGTDNDYLLAAAYAAARLLRLADGSDEVHRSQIGRIELKRLCDRDAAITGGHAAVLSVADVEVSSAASRWPGP
jgi:alkylation response protein AidB-like acyl-CoA dehydrogenase